MTYFAFGAVGIALIGASVWSWLGRTHASRWWTRSSSGELAVLVCLPALGFTVLSVALDHFGAPFWLAGTLLFIGVGVCFIWGLLISIASLVWWPARRGWGPRWYTRRSKRQVRDEESGESVMRRAAARRPEWAGSALAYWEGAQLLDPERPSRDEAMKGHLWVSEGGLWFDPLCTVEHTANPASVAWGEIIQVHSVPGNRNGGSVKVSGTSRRSFGPRLLVTASSGTQVFEIKQRAAAAAARLIQEEMEARRREHGTH